MRIGTIEAIAAPPLRKANDLFADCVRVTRPAELFDEFWRVGELALLFGAAGCGASLLAVQIAEALARGRPIEGFVMPTVGRRVLYVDLVLSDDQFRTRYADFREGRTYAKTYRFSERLYRERPPAGAEFFAWLRETVKANAIEVVVIDDLSVFKRTSDGTYDTLPTMRELRRICSGLNISMLVLTDAAVPRRDGPPSEADLGRSRILCGVADSVFAIGRDARNTDEHLLMQTRSRGGRIQWNERNAPVGTITRLDSGLLGLKFDARFADAIDDETRELICEVNKLRKGGETYRKIAKTLAIPTTRVFKLCGKWTPALEEKNNNGRDRAWGNNGRRDDAGNRDGRDPYGDDMADDDRYGLGRDDAYRTNDFCDEDFRDEADENRHAEFAPSEPERPPLQGPVRVSVYDLKYGIDGYGREIYIQSQDVNGKPMIWYRIDRNGRKTRCERKLFATTQEPAGDSEFL